MRRLHFRKRGFAASTVDGILYEEHGAGPSLFVVIRERPDSYTRMDLVARALEGRLPAGTPLLRLPEGTEIEVWEEIT